MKLLPLLAIVFFLNNVRLYSQSVDPDNIRNSGVYYWGTGTGNNYQEAQRNALSALSESIQVEIKHNFESVVREVNGNLEEYVKSVVTTYSSAVLRDYETKVLNEKPGQHEVLVYIERSRLEDYYNTLKQTADDFIFHATRAEQDIRIADALRYYYWALLLTRGHPDNEKLRSTFGGQKEEAICPGIYDRINNILSSLNVTVTAFRTFTNPLRSEADLLFTYQNKRVQDLDYTYWIGDGFSGVISVNNGIGAATYEGEFSENLRSVRLLFEYQYKNKAELDRNITRMFDNIDMLPFFSKAERNVPVMTRQAEVLTSPLKRLKFETIGKGLPDFENCRNVILEVIDAVQNKNFGLVEKHFTPDGFAIFQQLIAAGNVTVLSEQMDTLQLIQAGDELMVREVPMMFAYHNNRQKFVERVVFTFDKTQKINNITFALSDVAIGDIVNKPTGFGTLEEKYFLINFMENYKTAFALKRLDYIESIFADDALIIVGNVLKKAPDVENPWRDNEIIKYNTYTKQQYISNLAANFRRNEFINIRFEDNIVRKTENDDKIYGIQIEQHYFSSTYADKGYLFLMIDLSDTLRPMIYVRTWQPKKNPDGSIYGLEDFRL